jgi:hypothetical protein
MMRGTIRAVIRSGWGGYRTWQAHTGVDAAAGAPGPGRRPGAQVPTELGDHRIWDLSPFILARCALLSRVWAAVPVEWEASRAVARAPPLGHPCHRLAPGD